MATQGGVHIHVGCSKAPMSEFEERLLVLLARLAAALEANAPAGRPTHLVLTVGTPTEQK